ncbi:MAG: winged helix-turn-helix domain-containing protein [Chloroflexi bacterium]|nr:winged helix-turn-helix domain-containing protein [Chloroflexota bacterium]
MPEGSRPEAYLVLITDSGQREVHRVHGAMTLGRGPDSDLVLTNPLVSRRHAQLTWDGQRFLLQDLGSKNGTRINGAAIAAPTPLSDGDSLELADSRLLFQMSAPTVTAVLAPRDQAVSVDTARHEVRVRGELLALTPKEYRLLALLHRQAGAVVTREDIATEVWPELEGAVAEESIAQIIARLRRKVEEDPGYPRHIVTVRGFGYRFVATAEPGG